MSSSKKWLGFYFHIPFCPHVCPYCDFTKTSRFSKKDVGAFFSKLQDQLHSFLKKLRQTNPDFFMGNTLATIYFGGGTPGLFPASYYKNLIFDIRKDFSVQEITLETNPFSNRTKNFQEYGDVGFDRVTLGAQSLCEKALKHLGRKHTPEQVIDNIHQLRQAGFKNIQVDLIYGLQKEIRSKSIEQEILCLEQAGASGISAYALSIEKRTEFSLFPYFSNEDNAVEEYKKIVETCGKVGFHQIETSNFSRYEALHNQIYWHGHPYLGLGTGAHGLLPPTPEHPYGIRYQVGPVQLKSHAPGDDLLVYQDPQSCEENFFVQYENPRSKSEYTEEMIFTLLRTKQGIPLDWLSGALYTLLENPKIKRALAENKILCDGKYIALSEQEKIRGDIWALDFISLLSCCT